MNIILGSTSEHKLEAVRTACAILDYTVNVTSMKTKSGVNEQPFGLNETFQGAMNRANATRTDGAFSIGIESGIIPMGTLFVDMAVIVVITDEGREITTTSAAVPFPDEYVKEAQEKGFATTTVGSIIARELGGDETDPHATLTDNKITRQETLVDALIMALQQI